MSYAIRPARSADIPAIARYRAAMFHEMGVLPSVLIEPLAQRTESYLLTAIPAGEYVGWIAESIGTRETIGCAGVQVRRVLPHPLPGPEGVQLGLGRQGIVLNVYTEPAWRRRGIARELMETVIAWARDGAVETLVLHASDDGRALYQRLGFAATNEMRFTGPLSPPKPG